MRDPRTLGLLVVILGLSAFLRIDGLKSTPPGLYPDEAMNGNNALEAIRTGEYKVFYPENNGREGLMMNLQSLFLRVFAAREPWVLRLPSAIIGVLTVVGVFFLAKELFTSPVGLLAAFFTATSVWHIHFSRLGFRAILAPCLASWALYLFVVALDRARETGRRAIGPAALGGFVFGLGFHSYIAFRVLPLVFLAFLPRYRQDPRFWRVIMIFVVATGVAASPLAWYFIQHPSDFVGRSAQVSVFSRSDPMRGLVANTVKTAGMFFVRGDDNWRHNYAGQPALFFPVAILFAIGLARALGNVSQPALALLLCWMVVAAVPVITADFVPHHLRALLLVPPTMILAGLGAASLLTFAGARSRSSRTVAIICVAGSALLIAEAYYSYFIRWATRLEAAKALNADYLEIGRALERLPPDLAKYVVVDAKGVDVRGYPMPTQTVMFITDTFDPEMARQKHISYITLNDAAQLPAGAITFRLLNPE